MSASLVCRSTAPPEPVLSGSQPGAQQQQPIVLSCPAHVVTHGGNGMVIFQWTSFFRWCPCDSVSHPVVRRTFGTSSHVHPFAQQKTVSGADAEDRLCACMLSHTERNHPHSRPSNPMSSRFPMVKRAVEPDSGVYSLAVARSPLLVHAVSR